MKGKGKAEPLTIDCEFMNVLGFFDLNGFNGLRSKNPIDTRLIGPNDFQ